MLLSGFQARRWSVRPLRSMLFGALLVALSACGAGVGRGDIPPTPFAATHRAATLSSLPAGHVWATQGSRRYAVHDGRFYEWLPAERGYLAVAPPHGVAVSLLPRGSRETRLRGVTYHVYRGVYYKASRRNGRPVYVVVKL